MNAPSYTILYDKKKHTLDSKACQVFPDDTIEIAKGKIAKLLPTNDEIYLWCKTDVRVIDFVDSFLDNIFLLGRVEFKEIQKSLSCITESRLKQKVDPLMLFARDDARSILIASLPATITIKMSMGFHREGRGKTNLYFHIDPNATADADADATTEVDGDEAALGEVIDESSRLVESYAPKDDMIYVEDAIGIYDDKRTETKSLPDNILDTDQILRNINAFQHQKKNIFVNYIHLAETRTHTNRAGASLKQLFQLIQPTEQVPFVKLTSVSETKFKVHKSFIKEKDRLAKWTAPIVGSGDDHNHHITVKERIVAKVPIDKMMTATIYFSLGGKYEVKINFMKDMNVTLEEVSKAIGELNVILDPIFIGRLVPMDVHFWQSIVSGTQMMKVKCHGSIPITSKKIDHKVLVNKVLAMTPIFMMSGMEGNTISFMYKRINGFSSDDNILESLVKNTKQSGGNEPTTSWIASTFNISNSRASSIYDALQKRKSSVFYSSSKIRATNVLLRSINSAFTFMIEGTLDVPQIDRLIHTLGYMINSLQAPLKEKPGKKEKDKVTTFGWLDDSDSDSDGEGKRTGKEEDGDAEVDENGDGDGDGSSSPIKESVVVPGEAKELNRIRKMKSDLKCPTEKFVGSKDEIDLMVNAARCMEKDEDDDDKKEDTGTAKAKAKPKAKGQAKVARGGGIIKDLENKDYKYDSRGKDYTFNNGVHLRRNDVLKDLQVADKGMFNFKAQVSKNKVDTYARKCQVASHPVVMSNEETTYNKKCFPGALKGVVRYGSTENLASKNVYSCPKMWCPKSRVALTLEQFEKLGNKCPFDVEGQFNEIPMIFAGTPYVGTKERYISFLPKAQTQKDVCAPCCKQKPWVEKIGTKHYVMTAKFPLPKGRYGLLPDSMSSFFANKFCGQPDGAHGMISEKTNCYLRFGIPSSPQPFLQSIVTCFGGDNASITVLVDLICANLTMDLYLTLNHGLVCKAFMPNASISPFVAISSKENFTAFRLWFLHVHQGPYVDAFNLETMLKILNDMLHYTDDLGDIGKEILREFQLYSSFNNFIAYLKDHSIRKSHEHLVDLIQRAPWINKMKHNIIIISVNEQGEGIFETPVYQHINTFDKEQPTFILMKQLTYYEPIHLLVHKEKDWKKEHRWQDNPRIRRLFDMYKGVGRGEDDGTYFDSHATQIQALVNNDGRFTIDTHLLNYNFHVIAYVTTTHIVIPLIKPTPIDRDVVNKWEFVDAFFMHFGSTKKFKAPTKEEVNMVFAIINRDIPGYFKGTETLKINRGAVAVLLDESSHSLIKGVPIVPFQQIADVNVFQNLIKEGEVFIMFEVDDERITFMKQKQYEERMFVTLRNEIINIIQNDNEKYKAMEMLRHRSNPIPIQFRENYLIHMLQKPLKELIYQYNADNAVNPAIGKKIETRDGLCSIVKDGKVCVDPCKWLGAKGPCKLGVPKKQYDVLVRKCIVHLLNPFNSLEIEKWEGVNGTDFISFDSKDLEVVNGLDIILKRYMNFGLTDYTKVLKDVTFTNLTDGRVDDAIGPKMTPENEIKMMSLVKNSDMNNFKLYKQDANWIYPFFALISKRIDTKGVGFTDETLAQLVMRRIKSDYKKYGSENEEVGPCKNPTFANLIKKKSVTVDEVLASSKYMVSSYEVRILCEIINVNVVLIKRKTNKKGDDNNLRCEYSPNKKKSDYFVFFHMHVDNEKNTIEFQLYADKNDGKYLFTPVVDKMFSDAFRNCIVAKCKGDEVAKCFV